MCVKPIFQFNKRETDFLKSANVYTQAQNLEPKIGFKWPN